MRSTGLVPLACLLVIVSVGLYWSSVHFGFVSIDDGTLVVSNPLIQQPLSIATLWQTFTSYDPELYVPLTFLSYHLDFSLGGLDPSIFHFHNVLLHTLNVLLVFWLLLQLRAGRIAAFLGALLFAVHPLNAEAVLWVSARKDLLSTMFGLLSLNCFLQYVYGFQKRWYWLALTAFLFGLLAKVTVLLLPIFLLVLLLHDEKTLKQKFMTLAPSGALSVLFAIIAIIGKLQTFGAAIPLQYYPLLSAKALMMTLGKVFFPVQLSPLYPQLTPVTLLSPEFWLPMIGVLTVGVLMFLLRRRLPVLWKSAVLFMIGFAPSFLTFTKNGELYVTSDRYAYLACVGVAWIFGVSVMHVYAVLQKRQQAFATLWQVAIACIFSMLSVLTYAQAKHWQTDEALMMRVISTAPEHALAYNNLGVNFMNADKTAAAEKEFRHAIERNPHFILPRMNLAGLLMKQERSTEARAEYRSAIDAIDTTKRVRSDDLTAYYFLAGILEKEGDVSGALKLFTEAATFGTGIAEAQYNLAVTLQKYGKLTEAEAAYRRTIALDFGFVDAHFHLAELLAEQGRLQESLTELEAVVKLQPENAQARSHMENIRRMVGGSTDHE